MSSIKLKGSSSGEAEITVASDGSSFSLDKKLGIGTTAPAQMLHVKSSDARIRTEETGGSTTFEMTNTSGGHFLDSSGTNNLTINKIGAGDMLFSATNAERFRMLANGKICFGSTTAESTSIDNMQIDPSGGNIYMYQHTTSLQGVIDFRNPNGYIGSIRTTGSAVQFNESSDYRMKDNVNYTWSATDTVKSLKPCSFTFKGDLSTTIHGFIAHELQEHIPHAVSGVKDATRTDSDGSTIIDPQGVDLGKIVPYLVKTIQEQQAVIEDLQSRVTTLEG